MPRALPSFARSPRATSAEDPRARQSILAGSMPKRFFLMGGGTVFCPNARKEFHIPRPRSLQLRRSSGPSRELICRCSSICFPIFRTFLGDFNLQKLPSRRLEVLREWKNRVLLEEHYIFNVATPLGDECEHYSTTSTTTPATTTAATTTATPPGHSTSQIHTVNPSLSMVFNGF